VKIFVTGASGFIGKAFIRVALERGHRIGALSRSASEGNALDDGRISWFRGALDNAPLAAIRAFEPEACLHGAWFTAPNSYRDSAENQLLAHHSRVLLREFMRWGVGRIVALGSCAEYRITGAPMHEIHSPTNDSTAYSRWKNQLRSDFAADSGDYGVSTAWCRLFFPFGPEEHPLRFPTQLLKSLKAGTPLHVNSPRALRDYIYIEDVATALVEVVQSDVHGIINVGTGIGTAISGIVATAAEILGVHPNVTEGELDDPLDCMVADVSRLESLGWRSTYSIRSGLHALARFLFT
jgi:nucleoside-diphosphate-sugar epimerase